jgi:hypothetical protein
MEQENANVQMDNTSISLAAARNAQPIALRVKPWHLLAHLVSLQWPHSQVPLASVYYLLISILLQALVSPAIPHALRAHPELRMVVFLAVPTPLSHLLTHVTVTQHTI